MKRSPETLVQIKVLKKPARNEYNTKQKKKKENTKTNLPKVVNLIIWCYTMTEQRQREERHEKPS